MSDWFHVDEIGPGVVRITEPHVHPIFQANLYRIAGRDLDIQLDFGMGIRSLRELDFGDKPVLALASHAHVDHVGSLHEYARRAGHRIEAQEFASLDDEKFVDWFKSLPDAVSQVPYDGWDLSAYQLKAAPLTEYLADGDVIDLGDRRFTVLHLPGHSPGSIAILDEHNGEFFAADAIYDDELYDQLEDSNISDYVATMRRLLEVDARIVHGGHGPDFDGRRMHEIARDYIALRAG